MSGLLLYLGLKPIASSKSFCVFYRFLAYLVSHISFGSLETYRSFCENRFHLHTVLDSKKA